MPFYEGIGLIAEKNAVVIEVGSAFTKVGYAGEATPRAILPTPPALPLDDEEALYDALFELVHRVYFKHLLVNPRDRRVVILDPLIGPVSLKRALARVLFQHFEALSVLFAPSVLMPLVTLGRATGLVVDAGREEAVIMPVYEGVPVLKAWKATPLAGSKAMQAEVARLLQACTVKTNDGQIRPVADAPQAQVADATVIEDIQIRLCFVTDLERGLQLQKIRKDASQVSGLSSFLKKTVPAVTYPLPAGHTLLYVDGMTRESAAEVMFEPDDDGHTLASLLLDSILACPIDIRRELTQNIVVVGGTSMMVGFKARLFQEIKHLIKEENYYQEKMGVLVDEFKLHVTPTEANYASWTGASIFGATDAISTRSFTREMFLKEKIIPDWSDFRFNQLYVEEKHSS